MNEHFYAKILLFGEYGIILGSKALSIPYTHFMGELSFIGDDKYTNLIQAQNSNKNLERFANYLKNNFSSTDFDFVQLDADLRNGLYFESTIPAGYGIGSSGALVAAIYHSYARKHIESSRHITTREISQLKALFSTMESYFHGKSSGFDPLNAYLKFPLLHKENRKVTITGIPLHKFEEEGAVFLINTHKNGKTETYVNAFLSWCNETDFRTLIVDEYIPLINSAIELLLSGNSEQFFTTLKHLSLFQFTHFRPMIPKEFPEIWNEGNENNLYHLKLCGSGGGGFILGFAQDYSKARQALKKHGVQPVLVYEKKR